jgi:hypothetical protein
MEKKEKKQKEKAGKLTKEEREISDSEIYTEEQAKKILKLLK